MITERDALRAALIAALVVVASSTAEARPRRGGSGIPKVARDKAICFALYTVQNGILKLTAQLYPLSEDDSKKVHLEIRKGGRWERVAETAIVNPGWTAPFRVESWDMTRNHEYRIVALEGVAKYTGTIRRDPVDKETIVVAAFTGNSNRDRGPRPDLVKNIKEQDPDLLFFSGDQVYDHRRHLALWLIFGTQFGEIIKDRPTITIPDDHDVGHGNLWGAGGKKSRTGAGHDGGYFMPVAYVNEVQRAQTSHLPDPYDPAPVERGITVYYTAMTVGGVSFAVIEDRKFKSGPQGLVPKQGPRPDHIRNPNYDPKSVDVPGAKLLGERQLEFLREWGQDWRGADFKVVLSQTVFANAAHLHGGKGNRLHADMDSNGWPQTGRNKALAEIRRCFGFMLSGDQHLATVIHHGIDEWNDSGYSFCVPSIVNYYNRWWMPLKPGRNHPAGPLPHTGEFLDGFHNRITMHAYCNPDPKRPKHGKWGARAAGHGIVRFNRRTRKITIECWPRGVDVTNPAHKQYPGWPITIDQLDNYGRKAVAYLPTLKITGRSDPVVQVIDEAGDEIVHTLRIKGTSYRPKVFRRGTYTIKVGERGAVKTFRGVRSLPAGSVKTIKVAF